MWENLKKQAAEGLDAVDAGLTKFIAELPGIEALADGLGVRTRELEYSGAVEIQVDLPGKTRLAFCRSSPPRNQIKMEDLEQGGKVSFDPGTSGDFDFCLIAYYFGDEVEVQGHLLRGGVYRLSQSKTVPAGCSATAAKPLILETVKLPDKPKSDLLADVPRLSFGFAASGWLFVYQLGVAECLQNNGICKNPYVRVAGASGGALTGMLMMYGADMRAVRDYIKEKAEVARNDPTQVANLRAFVLGAMKMIIKDGSCQHPVLKSERLEICFSESAEDSGMAMSLLNNKAKQRRMKKFKDSSEAAIALLASSTMGISGLPFEWTDEEGKLVKVADGALMDFMPEVDSMSVRCMAFTDFMGFAGAKKTEIMPTEFVPSNYGVYPPPDWVFDHLYELGYQDMRAWLEKHLDERLAEIKASDAEAGNDAGNGNNVGAQPPTKLPAIPEFRCPDDGMAWYDKVLKVVPVEWKDQLTRKPEVAAPLKPLKEGFLHMEALVSGNQPGLTKSSSSFSLGESRKRWLVLTAHQLSWRPDEKEAKGDHASLPSHVNNPLAAESGTLSLRWVASLDLDPSNAQLLLIETSESMCVQLKAATAEEGRSWYADIKKALATLRNDKSPGDVQDNGVDVANGVGVAPAAGTQAKVEPHANGAAAVPAAGPAADPPAAAAAGKDKKGCCIVM